MGGGVSSIPSGYYNQYGYSNNTASTQKLTAKEQQEAIIQALRAEQEMQAQQAAMQQAAQTADGKDDGKIGFWGGVKNFFKGVGNFFKGMVCDSNGKFSLKRTLKTLAIGAGAIALTVATGGAAAPYLIAAGATMATIQTGKGVYKACTAKTDREAESAWQDIGSGVTGIAMSVAGAKGALKSAGVTTAPKGNIVTSALRATGECFRIAGKGAAAAAKGIIHPVQSAHAIGNYWSNTMKPNLQQAFSWKTAQSNINQANQEKINKNIAELLKEKNKLNTELQNPNITQARQNEIRSLLEQIQFKLNTESVKLSITKDAQAFNTQKIKDLEQMLATFKESSQNSSTAINAENQAAIKNIESVINFLKAQNKLNNATQSVQRGESLLNALNNKLNSPGGRANALTDAQVSALNSKISGIENIINANKNFLRLSNAKLAATQVLKQNGLGIASYHLSGAAPQTLNDQYAQMYGFSSLAEMEAYAAQNGVTAEQLADFIDAQCAAQGLTASQVTAAQAAQAAQAQAEANAQAVPQDYAQQQQYAYNTTQNPYMQNPYMQNPYMQNPYMQNPYMQNPYAMNMFNSPISDFNSLYVSPYPAMI